MFGGVVPREHTEHEVNRMGVIDVYCNGQLCQDAFVCAKSSNHGMVHFVLNSDLRSFFSIVLSQCSYFFLYLRLITTRNAYTYNYPRGSSKTSARSGSDPDPSDPHSHFFPPPRKEVLVESRPSKSTMGGIFCVEADPAPVPVPVVKPSKDDTCCVPKKPAGKK
jgi:hypothetical protein